MFLGTTFFCGKHCFMPPATNVTNFKSLSITTGTYDHLYLSTDTNKTVDDIDGSWTYDTKLNAKFETGLDSGNVEFSTKNTDTIVIKTREKGDFDWKTIYTIPIKEEQDFNFVLSYPYSRNTSNNEYKLISTVNGIENSYVITECITEFDGFFIVDKDNVYGTVFNIDMTDTTQNINNTVLELLNNIYPTVYTNSDVNYTTGTTSGCFLKFDLDECTIDIHNSVKYRKDVIQWLCNGNAKVLKLQDGRIYLIKVIGKPTDVNEGHEDLRRITFEWTEIGDVNSERDMYMNNLSDVTSEWW